MAAHLAGEGVGQRSNSRAHEVSPFVAVDAATLAAAKATSRLDHAGAARHLSRALERLPLAEAAPSIHFELLHALGRAHWRAGDRDASAAAFDQAWRVAELIDDVDRLARAAMGGGFCCDFSGDSARTRAARCQAALGRLPDGDSPARARLLAELAAALAVDPGAHRGRAQRDAAEATAMARRTADPVAIGYALVAEQFLNQGPSRLAQRIADAREILAIADGTREHPLEVLGRFCLLGALLEAGDPSLSTEIEAQTAAVARLREPGYRRHDVWFRCMRALLDGAFDAAEGLAQEGFNAALAASDPDALTVYGGQINTARWMQGRAAETAPTFELMHQGEPDTPMWPAVLAALRGSGGDLDSARALLAGLAVAAVPDDRHTLLTWSAIGEAAGIVGDLETVAEAHAALSPFADRMVPIGMGVASWGPVARQLGQQALVLGDTAAASRHFEAAIHVATRLASPPWIAWSELQLVAAHIELGRVTPGTAQLLAHGARVATTIGLPQLAERAAALRARLS